MSPSAISALTRKPLTSLPDGYSPAAPVAPAPRRRQASVTPSGTVRDWRYLCPCGAGMMGQTKHAGSPRTLSNARAKIEIYAAMSRHRRAWSHAAWASENPETAAAELARWQGWSTE